MAMPSRDLALLKRDITRLISSPKALHSHKPGLNPLRGIQARCPSPQGDFSRSALLSSSMSMTSTKTVHSTSSDLSARSACGRTLTRSVKSSPSPPRLEREQSTSLSAELLQTPELRTNPSPTSVLTLVRAEHCFLPATLSGTATLQPMSL